MITVTEYLLSAWEFELGSSEGLNGSILVLVSDSDRHDWLSNLNTSTSTQRFTISSSHSGLKSAI